MGGRYRAPSVAAHQPITILLGLVALNITLQLINAALIKYASSHLEQQLGLLVIVLAVVLALGAGRFLIWGAMHKRYPVSIAYPATALFFPCLVVLASALGEPVSANQFVGAGLVALGVLLLLRPKSSAPIELAQ